MNTTLYGGSATALFLLGYYFGKRNQNPLGELGISQADYANTMPIAIAKVSKQVAYAEAGNWLTSADQAEDRAYFSRAPAYDVRAHLTVAYWTAVAARLIHSRSLGVKAASTLAKGSALYKVPGSSLMTGSAASIMQAGLTSLKRSATSTRAQGAIEALESAADPDAIRAEQQKREGSSVTALPGKVKDALSPGNILKTSVDAYTDLWWNRAKWVIIIGGLGVGAWFVAGRLRKRVLPTAPGVML